MQAQEALDEGANDDSQAHGILAYLSVINVEDRVPINHVDSLMKGQTMDKNKPFDYKFLDGSFNSLSVRGRI